jgi:hypothetical protein
MNLLHKTSRKKGGVEDLILLQEKSHLTAVAFFPVHVAQYYFKIRAFLDLLSRSLSLKLLLFETRIQWTLTFSSYDKESFYSLARFDDFVHHIMLLQLTIKIFIRAACTCCVGNPD